MKLRQFNEQGIAAFKQYLSAARENPGVPVPEHLLEDDTLTSIVQPEIEVTWKKFTKRREAAEYLVETLEGIPENVVRANAGLWTWLSLFYFDSICLIKAGKHNVKNDYHYVYEPKNNRHYYRHLLFIAWRVLQVAPRHNRILLDTPLATLDKFTTEVMKRLFLTRIKCVFEVLDRIYWDPQRGRVRAGVVGSSVVRPGDLYHRFPQRIRQLEMTFDLVSLTADELIKLLGEEFDFAAAAKPERRQPAAAK